MIIDNLYNDVLINPVNPADKDELFIVSGYSSATFVRRHFRETNSDNLKINLIVGMQSRRGDHGAFLQLHNAYFSKFNAPHTREKRQRSLHFF